MKIAIYIFFNDVYHKLLELYCIVAKNIVMAGKKILINGSVSGNI
jgi:hypothetical protein